MRRANKGMDPERRVVCGIAAVVAVVVASVAFFGARDYGEGSSAADDLEIAYAAIDARDLSEDELRAVADCSFVFEDDANAAFERALERKSGEADHEA